MEASGVEASGVEASGAEVAGAARLVVAAVARLLHAGHEQCPLLGGQRHDEFDER